MTHHFVIPIEPQAWQRVKRSRTGIAYVPKETRQFKNELATIMRTLWHAEPLGGPLKLNLVFLVRPLKRPRRDQPYPSTRPDLDNYIKAVKDGLNGVLWVDDSQIVSLYAVKLYNTQPCGEIRIGVQAYEGEK